MPTYEYVCKSCGETIEVFQSFSDKPLRRHDACGGDLQKVFHARGIVFKGPGFYSTDARSSGSSGSSAKKAEKSEKKPEKSDSSKAAEKASAASPSTD